MKYLLVFALGFLSHKAIKYTYDYYWWKASYGSCVNTPGDLDNHFKCIYKELGPLTYARYVLVTPVPSTNRSTENKWYY